MESVSKEISTFQSFAESKDNNSPNYQKASKVAKTLQAFSQHGHSELHEYIYKKRKKGGMSLLIYLVTPERNFAEI